VRPAGELSPAPASTGEGADRAPARTEPEAGNGPPPLTDLSAPRADDAARFAAKYAGVDAAGRALARESIEEALKSGGASRPDLDLLRRELEWLAENPGP
jgi:hypothetical protein